MQEEGPGLLSRRDFIRNATLLGIGAAAGVGGTLATLSALDDRGSPSQPRPFRHGDRLLFVGVDALPEMDGGPLLAIYEDLPTVIFVLPIERLRASAEARGYNTGQYAIQHPEDPDAAVIAYDAKCTHLGCTVGWAQDLGASVDVEDYDGDGRKDGRLNCPCHQSQFDIHDLGKNTPNSPAPRPLDALSIRFMRLEGTEDPGLFLHGTGRIRQEDYRGADQQGAGAPFSLGN